MWFKRKKQEETEINCPVVTCEDCGCRVEKSKAHSTLFLSFGRIAGWGREEVQNEIKGRYPWKVDKIFYCGRCKKDYLVEAHIYTDSPHFIGRMGDNYLYYKLTACDSEGKLINVEKDDVDMEGEFIEEIKRNITYNR